MCDVQLLLNKVSTINCLENLTESCKNKFKLNRKQTNKWTNSNSTFSYLVSLPFWWAPIDHFEKQMKTNFPCDAWSFGQFLWCVWFTVWGETSCWSFLGQKGKIKINNNKSSSTKLQEFISSIQNSHYLQSTRNVTKNSLKFKIWNWCLTN